MILLDNGVNKLIEAPIDDFRTVLKGPTGCGKSTLLQMRYKYMVEKLHIPSSMILVLVQNRAQSLNWPDSADFEASGSIWRTSYYGFIQNELKTYYPIVLRNCDKIVSKRIKPVFINFDTAQYIVAKAIERRRDEKGLFSDLASNTSKIAADITSNLSKAALSGIPLDGIGSRLYDALEIKDGTKKQVFKELDEILDAYRKRCLEIGIFDFGISVDLYNKYLITDEAYREQLFKRVQHLIVDNIEECAPCEADLIEFLSEGTRSCLLAYNHEGGFNEMQGGDHKYAVQKLSEKFETISLGSSYTCSGYMYEFSEMLFDNITNAAGHRPSGRVGIERTAQVDLRSEMLDKVGEKVCQLLNQGYKPSEVAVISTYADPVTELVLSGILEKNGHRLYNISRAPGIGDNPYSLSLLTMARLCHPEYKFVPSRDDLRVLAGLLFRTDPVRVSIIAGELFKCIPFNARKTLSNIKLAERIGYHNTQRLEALLEWIGDYTSRESPMSLDEFLQRAFLEQLISEEVSEDDILQVNSLIESCSTFIDTVKRFGNINPHKGFLEMARSNVKAYRDLEQSNRLKDKSVLLATPTSFLSGGLSAKVVILISLSSKNWTPRSIKELTNARVLKKTWDKKAVYSEALEEENQKNYLATILRAITKRCGEKLITFESNLSANGYENDGILSECFSELLN